MTQPIEVAYVEILARGNDFDKSLDRATKKGFENVEKRSKATSAVVVSDFRVAAEGVRIALTNAFGPAVNFIRTAFTGIQDSSDSAFDGIKNSSKEAQSGLDRVGNAIARSTGLFGRLAQAGPAGIAILSSAFIGLVGAITVAARAVQNFITIFQFGIAGIPGLIAGVVASVFVLRAAFSGIGTAYEELTAQQNAAGSSGVSNARAVADAQRGVLQAQKDLIKAKEDEIDRIRELSIQLQRARATEARAADDVLKAEYALQRARDVGTPRSQIEAQLALDEARANLAESKEETKDLAAEKAKADKNGVSGSEAVLRAQEALLDAQDRLAQSQQTFSAGVANQTQAFDGLTKSAQAFVLALVSAKEQLGPVQDALQEAFFQGTAPLIQPIVDNIKELQPELTAVAAGFGGIFKEILKFLGTPEAKEALRSVLLGVSAFLTAITPSIGPLLKAFASLVGDSGELGKTLGDKVASALLKIADFVSKVDIEQLFKDAKEAVKEMTPFLKNIASIFKSLFDILAFAGRYTLPAVTLAFAAVAGILNFLSDGISKIPEEWDYVVKEIKDGTAKISAFIGELPAKITALGSKFLTAGKSLITKFFDGISTAGGFATDFAKNLANTFVRFFNNTVVKAINNGVKAIQDGINKIPGLSLTLPKLANIPGLESGGLITAESLFRGGEKGKKEAVLPLENSRVMAMIGSAIAGAGGVGSGGGGITFAPGSIVIQFTSSTPPTDARARQIGAAIASSAASSLERRNIRSRIRTM